MTDLRGSPVCPDSHKSCSETVAYYDRTYRYDLDRRSVVRVPVEVTGQTPQQAAEELQRLLAKALAGGADPLDGLLPDDLLAAQA